MCINAQHNPQGFDANSLYLSCISKDLPTGWALIRRKETGFCAEKSGKHRQSNAAMEYLSWYAREHNVTVKNGVNGDEHRVGMKRCKVDGFVVETNTILEFHGCFWHGHGCTKALRNHPEAEERAKKTQDCDAYLEQHCSNLEVMWECQWEKLKKRPEVAEKITDVTTSHPSHMVENEILDGVRNGSFFGFVQCNLMVPEHLREYFSEMTPIFKKTQISRDDVGEFMKSYAEKHDILKKPTTSLIGSYFAENYLVSTPLLKWYIDHGIVASNVSLTVQYEPKAVFEWFGEHVTNMRREADKDSSSNLTADSAKLKGNSAYGKFLEDVEKHLNTKFISKKKVKTCLNSPLYRKLNVIDDDHFEVDLAKKIITQKTPTHVALFILDYAKLRMLEFYYDFIDKFIERALFIYINMDTGENFHK